MGHTGLQQQILNQNKGKRRPELAKREGRRITRFSRGNCNNTKLGNAQIAKQWWSKSLVNVDDGDYDALST